LLPTQASVDVCLKNPPPVVEGRFAIRNQCVVQRREPLLILRHKSLGPLQQARWSAGWTWPLRRQARVLTRRAARDELEQRRARAFREGPVCRNPYLGVVNCGEQSTALLRLELRIQAAEPTCEQTRRWIGEHIQRAAELGMPLHQVQDVGGE